MPGTDMTVLGAPTKRACRLPPPLPPLVRLPLEIRMRILSFITKPAGLCSIICATPAMCEAFTTYNSFRKQLVRGMLLDANDRRYHPYFGDHEWSSGVYARGDKIIGIVDAAAALLAHPPAGKHPIAFDYDARKTDAQMRLALSCEGVGTFVELATLRVPECVHNHFHPCARCRKEAAEESGDGLVPWVEIMKCYGAVPGRPDVARLCSWTRSSGGGARAAARQWRSWTWSVGGVDNVAPTAILLD